MNESVKSYIWHITIPHKAFCQGCVLKLMYKNSLSLSPSVSIYIYKTPYEVKSFLGDLFTSKEI